MDLQPHEPAFFQRGSRVRSGNFSKEDLSALFRLLEEQNRIACDNQIKNINPHQADLDFDRLKSDVTDHHLMTVRITDSNDNVISQNNERIFSRPDFPSEIKFVYFSNIHSFKAQFGFEPRDSLSMFLDFSKPSLAINLITLPSNPTTNEGAYTINGMDGEWVDSTFAKISRFLDERKNRRNILHGSGFYDLMLYVFGLPIIFYWIYFIDLHIIGNFEPKLPTIVTIFIYVYFTLIGMIGFRFIFQYIRWIWPPVEYKVDVLRGPAFHRAALYVLSAIFLFPLLNDLVRVFIFDQ